MKKILELLLGMPRSRKRVFSVLSDIVLLAFSLWAAVSLRLGEPYMPIGLSIYICFALTITASVLVFARLGLYRAIIRYLSLQAFSVVLVGVGTSAVLFAASSFLLHVSIPRSATLIYLGFAFLFVGGSRMLVRGYVQGVDRRKREKVIIYGAGSAGLQLLTALAQAGEYQPIAYIDDDKTKQGTVIQGIRIYGRHHLDDLIAENNIDTLLIAIGRASRSTRSKILEYLEPLPVQVKTIPDMADIVSGRARIEQIRDIDIDDLLGRKKIDAVPELVSACIENKVVLISGAGGSIGAELCRHIIRLNPARLVMFEQSEYGLYRIERELKAMLRDELLSVELVAIMGSVQNRTRIDSILKSFQVETIYHAAAYKHVPMVEHNMIEGIRNNLFGTLRLAEAAIEADVKTFVLISTDKAVRPTNVMGASKRMAELVLQGLDQHQDTTRFCMVRFGNVLGSSGSVVPLFRAQIRKGGPVTVTHEDITRYFMTIPEAVQLVLQASSMGQGGDVFILDMGKSVRIADLARRMIHLMGHTVLDDDNPDGDIEIEYSGLRPGEKLYEELLIGDNPLGTDHPQIMKAQESFLNWNDLKALLEEMDQACLVHDCHRVRELLLSAPTGFQPTSPIEDLVSIQSDIRERHLGNVVAVTAHSKSTTLIN